LQWEEHSLIMLSNLSTPAQASARHIYKRYRKITSPIRAFPNYIIVGAQRCGTTALSYYLSQHPEIYPATKKEVHYFDNHYQSGERWYRAHFPIKSKLIPKGITGEASPYYMYHPFALQRIKALLPDVKIIILLRDPVNRAISNYLKEVNGRGKYEKSPIKEAMLNEELRLKDEYLAMKSDSFYGSLKHQIFSYKARGIYYPQVKKCFDLFDRNNVLVINSKDLLSSTESSLREVFKFLEVDSHFSIQDIRPRNVEKKRYTSPVPAEVRDYLTAFFEPHNKKLYGYLGRDFGW
jgi:hypothetical protein